MIKLIKDCATTILKELPDNSIDSMVTDPPAGIGFMGKEWDSDKGGSKQWIDWMSDVMRECLRVLKPGAHALVWAIPRTSHWTATALEEAGFEIRDVITHIFGTGFPKSLDISKAIDKAAGAEREYYKDPKWKDKYPNGNNKNLINSEKVTQAIRSDKPLMTSDPSTPEAKQWQGWGTALKPASEHWILVRKPLEEKTIAANVLKHGTGGINIDTCRIQGGLLDSDKRTSKSGSGLFGNGTRLAREEGEERHNPQGRFPSNLILDEVAAEMLGEQSRFFYCAKSSKAERNLGCEGLGPKGDLERGDRIGANQNTDLGKRLHMTTQKQNHHPTVKPQKLMRYLCKLVTPPRGIVLDPFMGSGSTGVAAHREGFRFIGIEKEPDYFTIAEARIARSIIP